MPIPNLQDLDDLTFIQPSGITTPTPPDSSENLIKLYSRVSLLEKKVNEIITRLNLVVNEVKDL